ncbi:MAG TPA: trehalase family glycosidase [Tepidisphaeraceae bacterium]|nr:trehalase family glycosidase [Tepidisphaeraceae bacterium]
MSLRSPALRSVWGGGQLLALSGMTGPTDYERGLVGRTSFSGCGIDLVLPYTASLRFSGSAPMSVFLGGDHFQLILADAPAVRGAFIDAHHLLVEGTCAFVGAGYDTVINGSRTLIAPTGLLDRRHLVIDLDQLIADRQKWTTDLRLPAGCDEATADAYLKARVMIRTQTLAAEGAMTGLWTTPDRWPHRDMWLWDSVFHAIGIAHFDRAMARRVLDAMFDVQRVDGFIPHQAAATGWRSQITQPPVLAFGMERVMGDTSDLDWIAARFDQLAAYLRWNEQNRDTDGNGLVEWYIEANEHCRSGESGMDNSPRFDDAVQLDAVDFNSFMAAEYRTLARFARLLGRDDDARRCDARHRELCASINGLLWDESTGFYQDRDVVTGRRTGILANSGFLPLICGAASAEQAQRLARHLEDPATFGTTVPVPSVAVSSRRGGEKDMWRGPMWVNLNWLIEIGLRDYGLTQAADHVRERTVAEIVRHHQRHGTFYEFYDSDGATEPGHLDRKGHRASPGGNPYHRVIHDFGWTATLFIDMVHRAALDRAQPGQVKRV